MKKLITLLLLGCALWGLAGCASAPKEAQAPSSAPAESVPTEEAEDAEEEGAGSVSGVSKEILKGDEAVW